MPQLKKNLAIDDENHKIRMTEMMTCMELFFNCPAFNCFLYCPVLNTLNQLSKQRLFL